MNLEGGLFDHTGDRKYLNASERRQFYEVARAVDDPLRKAFLMTLFYTGARISEALQLRGTNIDLTEELLVLRTLKQRGHVRCRAVPIPAELSEWLREPAACEQRIWWFCRTTGWQLVKECMRQAEITGIRATPKGLRHGFAVACISKGIPVSTVRKWMGHARLESTTVYLNIVGEDERQLASRLWDTLSA